MASLKSGQRAAKGTQFKGSRQKRLLGIFTLSQLKTSCKVIQTLDRRPQQRGGNDSHEALIALARRRASCSQGAFHWEQSAVTYFPAGMRRPKGWRHPPAPPWLTGCWDDHIWAYRAYSPLIGREHGGCTTQLADRSSSSLHSTPRESGLTLVVQVWTPRSPCSHYPLPPSNP